MIPQTARRWFAQTLAVTMAAGGLAFVAAAPATAAELPASGERIVSWRNASGNPTNPAMVVGELSAPAGESFIDVAVGANVTLGVTSGGDVVAGGSNDGSSAARLQNIPAEVNAKDVVAVETLGGAAAAAIDADGGVTWWGWSVDSLPTPGAAGSVKARTDMPADLGPVRQLAFSNSYGLAALEDGSVRLWGGAADDQLHSTMPEALKAPGVAPWRSAVIGSSCAVVVGADGTPYAWGSGPCSQVPAAVQGQSIQHVTQVGSTSNAGYVTESGEYAGTSVMPAPPAEVLAQRPQQLGFAGNQEATGGAAIGRLGQVTLWGTRWDLSNARAAIGDDYGVALVNESSKFAAIVSSTGPELPDNEVDEPGSVSGDAVLGGTIEGTPATFIGEVTERTATWFTRDADGNEAAIGEPTVVGDGETVNLELDGSTAGKSVFLRTTATFADGSTLDDDSDPVGPVSVFSASGEVTGDPVVGGTLTGEPASFGPGELAAETVWMTVDENGVEEMVSGTNRPVGDDPAELELTPAMVGKEVFLRTTVLYLNGDAVEQFDDDSNVVGPVSVFASSGEVTGDPVVGGTLTGEPASFGSGVLAAETVWMTVDENGVEEMVTGSNRPVGDDPAELELTPAMVGKSVFLRTTVLFMTGQDVVQYDDDSNVVGPVSVFASSGEVTGDPVVGGTLTGEPASFGSGVLAAETVWMTVDENGVEEMVTGSNTPGATDPVELELTPAMVGKSVFLRTTALFMNGQDIVQYDDDSNVVGPVEAIDTPSSAEGEYVVSGTVTGKAATFHGDPTVTTQWMTVDGDGAAVVEGTQSDDPSQDNTLAIEGDLAGKQLFFRTSADYGDGIVFTSDTDAVEIVNFALEGDPVVTGTPRVDEVLTAEGVTATPPDAELHYKWFAGDAPINGATSATFSPTTAEIGEGISVEVHATYGSLSTDAKRSAATEPVVDRVRAADRPTIAGTAKVGERLTGTAATFNDVAGLEVASQWLADGQPIEGVEPVAGPGAEAVLPVTEGMVGQRITLQTRGAAGDDVVTVVSDPTDAVVNKDGSGGGGDGPGVDPERPDAGDLEDAIQVNPREVVPGSDVVITVGAERAGQQVTVMMFSEPRNLGTYTVAQNGTIVVNIPADTSLGTHRIAVYDAEGQLIGWQDIQVISADEAAGRDRGALGNFGATASKLLAPIGLVVLLSGALMAGLAWRRRVS